MHFFPVRDNCDHSGGAGHITGIPQAGQSRMANLPEAHRELEECGHLKTTGGLSAWNDQKLWP